MPTTIMFLAKELSLDVQEDVNEVRKKLDQEARSARLVEFERRAPRGQAVWINPASVSFFHEALEYETHSA
jgi:hypothetical protein